MPVGPTLGGIDAAVMAAHAAGDGAELACLYAKAADILAADGNTDKACFFYTQAYIFALEQGLAEAMRYARILAANGRL